MDIKNIINITFLQIKQNKMKILIKNKHWKLNEEYNSDKILYLLIDRPSYINNNCLFWENKNQWHREYDLPAVVHYDGYVVWCKKYKFHREKSKPARIWRDGQKEYCINGNFIKETK